MSPVCTRYFPATHVHTYTYAYAFSVQKYGAPNVSNSPWHQMMTTVSYELQFGCVAFGSIVFMFRVSSVCQGLWKIVANVVNIRMYIYSHSSISAFPIPGCSESSVPPHPCRSGASSM